MKSSFPRTVLFSLLTSLALPLAAQQEDVSARETARRQAQMRDALQQVEEARAAYTEKKYSDAVEHYRNALAVIPKAPATQVQLKFIQDSLSDALIAKAMDYRSVGRYEEAVSFLNEAIKLSPENDRARTELSRTQDPVRHNPALTPQHVGDVEEVNRLLAQGYAELDLGNYDKAQAAFSAVGQYDAYNTAAVRGMEAVQKRRMQFFDAAHDATRADALAAVDATWANADGRKTELPVPTVSENASADALPFEAEEETRIAESLKTMVMPQITFDDASVMDVMEALQAQINRFEAEGKGAGRHINLTPNFGTMDSEGYKTLMAKTVRMTLNDVSVKDVLEILTKQLGVTYYITPIGVTLSYSGKDFGPMVERVYTVAPHFFDVQEEGGDDDEDDDYSSGSSSRVSVRRVNPETALKGMGVSFPEGARARYNAADRRLTVLNTPYNQEDIAELLSVQPDSSERSVILNVMAVEVSQADLEALGFEWLVNFDLTSTPMALTGGVSAPVEAARPQGAVPKESHSMTESLRSTAALAASTNNVDRLISMGGAANYNAMRMGNHKDPGVFAFRGVWNAADVAVIMRGLSQKKGADVLYNPRLVLSPHMEEQVVFANVRELFYPESYEAPQISSSSFNFGNRREDNGGNNRNRGGFSTTATAAHPEEFTRFGMSEDGVGGIGAVLQVHQAEVAKDGQHVTLALTVTVNDFEGFVNWGTPIKSMLFTQQQTEPFVEITLSDNKILKPVFKRRMENTKITVAPGAVIVMGGLQESQRVKYEDKLPVLGDLPLVGRLFRSEGEEQTRKAYLFFAKVDLVDPTGNDPRTGSKPTEDDIFDN